MAPLHHLLLADLVARRPAARQWSGGRRLLVILTDPSLRAVVTFRLAASSPGRLVLLWRLWTIARYRSEIFRCTIGPGLRLPHPYGIVIAEGVTIGSNATLHDHVTLGTARAPAPGEMLPVPRIGDRVTIGSGTVVAGQISVGPDVTIDAGSVISRDLPPS